MLAPSVECYLVPDGKWHEFLTWNSATSRQSTASRNSCIIPFCVVVFQWGFIITSYFCVIIIIFPYLYRCESCFVRLITQTVTVVSFKQPPNPRWLDSISKPWRIWGRLLLDNWILSSFFKNRLIIIVNYNNKVIIQKRCT